MKEFDKSTISKIRNDESEIANAMKLQVHTEDEEIQIKIMRKHLGLTKWSIDVLCDFVKRNPHLLIDFTSKRISGKNKLGIGFSLKNAAYLLYLQNNDTSGLLTYIKKLRLENPNEVVKSMEEIYRKINT